MARAINPNPSGAQAVSNVRALVDLCTAQTETIRSLGAALQRRQEEDVDRRAKRATLAHQLDTPMASLVSTLRALAWPNFDPDVTAELLEQVTRQAEQLHRLVQDLLCNLDYEYKPVLRAAQELVPLRQIVEDSVLASSSLSVRGRAEPRRGAWGSASTSSGRWRARWAGRRPCWPTRREALWPG